MFYACCGFSPGSWTVGCPAYPDEGALWIAQVVYLWKKGGKLRGRVLGSTGMGVALLALGALPVLAAGTSVVTRPVFATQGISGSVAGFSPEETILGRNSVKLSIPQGVIGEVYNLGLNAEVTMPGHAPGLGISMYDGVSFRAKPGPPGVHGSLFVSIILYDDTHDVWVSMINYSPVWTAPDAGGWSTVSVPAGASWDAWTFGGDAWPVGGDPGYVSLAQWDQYIHAQGIKAEVKKLNIQFGYGWHAWGTVYVDGLAAHGFLLDFGAEAS